MELDARIIAADLVKPYRRQGASGKSDANDAAAVCEAASRPSMHFVPIKSVEQQSVLSVHRLREDFKADRVAYINRVRGLLSGFGLVFPQGCEHLRSVLDDVIEDASNELGHLARLTLQRAAAQWREFDEHLAWCDERIAAHVVGSECAQRALALRGIGPVSASAVVVTVGDFRQFKNGAQSAVFVAHRHADPISAWVTRLRDRAGWQRAAVALASKNARILWAIMTKAEAFDPRHISVKPSAAPA